MQMVVQAALAKEVTSLFQHRLRHPFSVDNFCRPQNPVIWPRRCLSLDNLVNLLRKVHASPFQRGDLGLTFFDRFAA